MIGIRVFTLILGISLLTKVKSKFDYTLTLSKLDASPKKCGTDQSWDDEAINTEFRNAIAKIKGAVIDQHPFPHFSIENWLSGCFYKDLINELPAVEEYISQEYPGTLGHYEATVFLNNCTTTKCRVGQAPSRHNSVRLKSVRYEGHGDEHRYGKTLFAVSEGLRRRFPLWYQMYRLVHSQDFVMALYDKLAVENGDGVPLWKRKLIGNSPLMNSAAMRIDPYAYHLSPHVDRWEKVCTWQFFHPSTDILRDRKAGTRFYVPKKEYNFEVLDRNNPRWMDYSFFEVVKEMVVVPNFFFAFAPNNRSFHGAEIVPEQMEGVPKHLRRTFLGFVTNPDENFHHFAKDDYEKSNVYTLF